MDVNERCVTLTNENAALLGLENVTASTPEAVDPELRFDTIWSNPPIRIGKDELHALLLLWLPRLAPGGSAWLVVQKNLGSDSLQRWLAHELDEHLHGDPGEHRQNRSGSCGSGKRPASHDYGRAAELHMLVAPGARKELHADDAAGDVDVPGVRSALPRPSAGSRRRRRRLPCRRTVSPPRRARGRAW